MSNPLLTIQACERKFDLLTTGAEEIAPHGFDEARLWLKQNQDKHLFENDVYGEPMFDLSANRVKDFIRSSFIQLLQSQISEWKGMMHPRVKTVNYCEVCDVSDPNCDTNRILLSLINSNEEVISKINGK